MNAIKPHLILAGTALAVSMVASSATAGLVMTTTIDDFSDTNSSDFPLAVAAGILPSASASETGLSGVLGGDRLTELALTSDSGLAAAFVDDGNLLFELSSSLNATGTLGFGYGTSAGGSSLAANFVDQLGISVSIAGFDFASDSPLGITVTLTDEFLGEIELTQSVTSSGAQDVVFLFQDFTPSGGGGSLLAFDNISGIDVDFTYGGGADFQITSIQTVIPAPGAAALLLSAGLVGPRRRRRN
ncbi:MAG: hypothetical protein AAF432_10275 [Planctomycetota bacterium]